MFFVTIQKKIFVFMYSHFHELFLDKSIFMNFIAINIITTSNLPLNYESYQFFKILIISTISQIL